VWSRPGEERNHGGEDELPPGLNVRLWDPSTQLRFRAKRKLPRRPDGARSEAPASQAGTRSTDQAQAPQAPGWGD
jgi:hypothetical protein